MKLTGANLSKVAKERLKAEYGSRKQMTDKEFKLLKASLGAVISHHLPLEIAKAITEAKEITPALLPPGSKAEELFHDGEMGFFAENIMFGGGVKGRSKPYADLSFSQMENETRRFINETAKRISKRRIAKNKSKDISEVLKNFSKQELGDFFRELNSRTTKAGTELKSYEQKSKITVGEFTINNPHTDDDALIGAVEKLYSKMNTLFLLSVSHGQTPKGERSLRVTAADIFSELIIDKVIVGITSELVSVRVSKTTDLKGEIIKTTYEVEIIYSKLEEFLKSIAGKISSDLAGADTQSLRMRAAGIYKYDDVLYPASQTSDFFGDVLGILQERGLPIYAPKV